jgi:hypothetical protein
VQIGAVRLQNVHVGQHVVFGLIHDGGELLHLGPDLVGHGSLLGVCGFGYVLCEGGGALENWARPKARRAQHLFGDRIITYSLKFVCG